MDRTNPQRQARYRLKKARAGEFKRINYWVDASIVDRITMYAKAFGCSKMTMLERMVMSYRLPRVRRQLSKKTRSTLAAG